MDVGPESSTLVRDFAVRWQEQQIHQCASSREAIAKRVEENILPVLGDKRIEQVSRQDVQEAEILGHETLAARTVKRTNTYLSGIMKPTVLDGLIKATPCVGVRLPRAEHERVRPLSTETVQAIADVDRSPYIPIVVFCAATGMRGGEMRGLTWDRVDLVRGSVTVDRQLISRDSRTPAWGPAKSASSVRTVNIGAATVEMLKNLPQAGPLVFHHAGRSLTRHAAADPRRAARLKLPGIGDGWHQVPHHHTCSSSQGACG
ncbi:hypothetical protein I6N91_03160 [Arthrobacter sp. MSA 4-2]|uniref:tyrosine-type recombinase/integrase n=1 Tax=Arthrobacter sp. MSA 4-2 TaxID=2794349 RepID=UPI0018E7E0D8|nr:site-specific integrase [Arthrobacter sp. MSA 4-2]MBJ2119973.1 hypothetical protein [Arthrobacter sp. MSA 4-2]